MSETRVGNHTFVYNGERYFRDKSEDILMCSYGEKEDPLGTKASLNVTNHVDRDTLKGKVRYVTTADIDWTRQAKADVETGGALKYFTVSASGTASFSYEKAKSVRLKLAKFVIDEGPLKTMLNNEASGARRFLADRLGRGDRGVHPGPGRALRGQLGGIRRVALACRSQKVWRCEKFQKAL